MSIATIKDPLPGERVVALAPESLTESHEWLLRRPNLFPGRSLTAATLEGRQDWAAHHVRLRGQAFTAGVVRGLEAVLVPGTAPRIDGARLALERGVGLCVSGEDVRVPRGADVSFGSLPVVADPSAFAGGGSAGGGTGGLTSKVVGETLGTLVQDRPDALPRVGILLLQPVTADRVGEFDATDPCVLDGCGDTVQGAFEDWRIGDGARLLWYAWPEEWRTLPAVPLGRPGLWRNQIAWRVFEAEHRLAAGELMPWEAFGLPLALVACAADWSPLFLDRASVVRTGGRARFTRMGGGAAGLTTHWRLPGLWQARVEQLAEQIADHLGAGPGGSGTATPDPGALAAQFSQLPAFGLLPADVVDLDPDSADFMRCSFFASSFELDAVPVPQEQLDAALGESASLGPLDLSAGGRVRLLVPVPQALFEPRLLIRERIDQEFADTLDGFLLARARHLGARQALRRRAAVIARGIFGTALEVPAIEDDPDALESEALAPWGPPPAGGGHRSALAAGLHEHGFEAASEAFTVRAGESLSTWVYLDPENPPRALMLQWHAGDNQHRAWWGEDLFDAASAGGVVPVHGGELPAAGEWVRLDVSAADLALEDAAVDGMVFSLHDGRAAYGATGAVSRSGAARDWFAGLLPTDAVVNGNDPWQSLTHNDLWAPFESTDVLTPVAVAQPPAGGGHTEPAADGLHQHFFEAATAVFTPVAGERLFAWVFLDPTNPPTQVMLQWRAEKGWDHRAYWGTSRISWGQEGTASRFRAGALPPPGRWVRLEVPAADAGVEDTALNGMAFTFFDGSAAFGASGALPVAADGSVGAERVWFAGKPPSGARLRGNWQFLDSGEMRAPTAAAETGELQALARLYDDPALAHLSGHERYQLYLRGASGFIAYLKSRADRADDLVDYGFVKVQTDIYRVRQLVLGTTAATRLAVSPALASIAGAETAVASTERISSFFAELKAEPVAGVATSRASATSGPAGAAPGAGATAAPAAAPSAAAAATLEAGVGGTVGDRLSVGGLATGGFTTGGLTGAGGTGIDFGRIDIGRGGTGIDVLAGRETGVVLGAAGAQPRAEVVPVLAVARFTPLSITNEAPIIGRADVRTVSIAQRLEAPKATEAKDYTSATRYEALRNLIRLADELTADDAGDVPGLFQGVVFHGLRGDPVLYYDSEAEVDSADRPLPDVDDPEQQDMLNGLRRSIPFSTILRERWRAPLLLRAPRRTRNDESVQFSESADLSDNTVALMRQVEGRVKQYRDSISVTEAVLAALRARAQGNETRLGSIGTDLAEARHDVALARALIAEEEARLAAINERRADTLREHVQFIAYQRPREAELVIAAPLRQLDPGLIPAPVPACLKEHQNAPDELRELLALVREAPARWFVAAAPVVDRLDRVDLLVRTVQSAQLRSQVLSLRVAAEPVSVAQTGIAGAVAGLRNRRQASIHALRGTAARLDPGVVAGLSWSKARAEADKVISLGDLIDGEHGRGEVARRAASLFEDVSQICACVHEAFSAVPPAIRLQWAQTMSQFDESPRLRNLASLGRFAELDYELRRGLQGFADWLFGQVRSDEAEAEALINDLLRMCLLLASHAPVNQIIAGRLPAPATARPGVRLPIQLAAGLRPRIGMQALVYQLDRVVARARVDDLGNGEVSATVLQVEGSSVDLAAQTRVQFLDPENPVALYAARVSPVLRR